MWISTVSILPNVPPLFRTTRWQQSGHPLSGSKALSFGGGCQGTIHVLRIMQRGIIILKRFNWQCMPMLLEFPTDGLLAGEFVALKASQFPWPKLITSSAIKVCFSFLGDSDVLIKNWKDSQESMLPTYKELIAAGLRIWVFRLDLKSYLST